MTRAQQSWLQTPRGRRRARAALLVSVGAALVAVLLLSLFWLPGWVVTDTESMERFEVLNAENDVRSSLLTAYAGLFFLVTAFLSWKQIQVAREGHLTDRFAKAVGLLGSRPKPDETDPVDVRLGGVASLERVAFDSLRDRQAIIDVLAGFVREHSPAREARGPADDAGGERGRAEGPDATVAGDDGSTCTPRRRRAVATDIQASLSAICRLTCTGQYRVDLTGADLTGANLEGAQLAGVVLRGARLRRANLSGADLTGADLSDADMSGDPLEPSEYATGPRRINEAMVILRGAVLRSAVLQRADLAWADLTDADLTDADLSGGPISIDTIAAAAGGVRHVGANLHGTVLRDAVMTGADLDHARYSDSTLWPDGTRRQPSVDELVPKGWTCVRIAGETEDHRQR